ncbi:MAG: hypothetical protein NTV22_18570 [bacterium]|nr:hypothetical protein [bacterium]
MRTKYYLLIIGAVLALFITLVLGTLYGLYLFLKPSGIVKITTTAIDRRDHIAFDIRVVNLDTSRYLSNYSFSFVSYEKGAYKAILKSVVPAVVHTNTYYVFGPSNSWDDQVITLDPHLKCGLGESICAQFTIMKNTNSTITEIHGSVGYRGQRILERILPRIVEGIKPTDYVAESFRSSCTNQ